MPPRRPRFVDTASRVPAWKALHAVADAQYPSLAALWASVFAELRDVVTQDAMREALTRGDLAAVQALLARAWPTVGIGQARAPLLALLRATVEQAAGAVTPLLRETLDVGVQVRFNVISQKSLTWIARYGATQIREIGQTSMQALRDVIRRQFQGELSVTEVMDALQQVVGLTARQAHSLETLRGTLAEAGVTPGEATRQAEAAAARALRNRVEAISRTEALAAANSGSYQSTLQAEQRGLLTDERFQRKFVVTPDPRLCPICAPMNGQLRGLHEPFVSPATGATALFPPMHVSCRCTVSIVSL